MSCPDDFFPTTAPVPASTHRLLDGLNPEQRHAVTLGDAHALILAGAGSGKTRVLTTRIAWLLAQQRVSAGGIMAVTFTNKAAREMAARLSAMLPVSLHGMWMGTFHGLCHRFLRAHWRLAGLPQGFQILDTQDQLSAIKRLYKQVGISDERYPPKQMQWFISNCKEEALRPGDVAVSDGDSRRKAEIYQLYEEQCQREGVVDFGELMLRSYELLRDRPDIRQHYQRRFRHILVDEFQDTNRLQYLWLKLFAVMPDDAGAAGEAIAPNYLFAVGDDDQSIYAFRGARVGNMNDFVREFGIYTPIKLEQNYRSYSNILDSANTLISHNSRRLGKNLRTEAGAGEPVRVVEQPSDLQEAQWLADEVRALIRNDSPLREIAVLYRSNAQSRAIESQLFSAGVPYRVYGGLRFFERAEIKHALAYLRLLENPADDTSFLRVVNFPPRGIGTRTIEQLQDAARVANCALHQAITQVAGKAGANLASFVAKLDVMREQARHLPLTKTIAMVLDASGLLDHYRSERDGEDRVENLEELVNAAEVFVSVEGFLPDEAAIQSNPYTPPSAYQSEKINSKGGGLFAPLSPEAAAASDDAHPQVMPDALSVIAADSATDTGESLSPLAAFLTHAALEAGDNQAQAGADAVQLMTVHSAKGLEFNNVFITGLEEGLFPHDNALNDHDGLEEERRLMYVAITRARQRLYISYAQSRMLHGQTRPYLRSRFIDELPEECLKWIGGSARARNYRDSHDEWNQDVQHVLGRYTTSRTPRHSHAATPPQQDGSTLRTGQQVFHNKFGEGTVLMLEGRGDEAKAQIHFPRHGVKWLVLAVAKLTPIED